MNQSTVSHLLINIISIIFNIFNKNIHIHTFVYIYIYIYIYILGVNIYRWD
ncbi:hypothetical protein K7X86_00265 [Candidatus Sulcia muelleri]|nr:hypothetical protein [Candidatus Karelsulcia muelleri]